MNDQIPRPEIGRVGDAGADRRRRSHGLRPRIVTATAGLSVPEELFFGDYGQIQALAGESVRHGADIKVEALRRQAALVQLDVTVERSLCVEEQVHVLAAGGTGRQVRKEAAPGCVAHVRLDHVAPE